MADDLDVTGQTRVRRIAERGLYGRAAIYDILDEALICHVGLVENGQPFVLPMIHARWGDRLLLHGSMGSRLLRCAQAGNPLCITVTLLDGLVLARSAFHHSMNYRSVVLLGRAEEVVGREEKVEALRVLSEHVARGRWDEVRGPNEDELKQTRVVAVPIEEASAKVRVGPPGDEEEDYALDVWAGVLPLALEAGVQESDPLLRAGIEVPGYVASYRR